MILDHHVWTLGILLDIYVHLSMAELSQRNKDRLSAWVARQARLRDPESSIDPCLIETPDHSTVFRSPACLDIPRFPVIASCKHVLS